MALTRPIFVIAQETTLRAAVARLLITDGEHVELADSVKRAREILGRGQVRLTIIAPRRLGADGWALARDLHSTTERLIVLTDAANQSGQPEIPIPGVRICPGYPLDEPQLLGQVKSLLAAQAEDRASGPAATPLRFAGFTLDVGGHAVRNAEGREVPLTPAEFALLLAFARSPGRVLSRDQLLTMVAGREADSFDRGIDVLVGRVRRKIEPDPKRPSLILTMPRVGYKFTAKPELHDASADASVPERPVKTVAPQPMEHRQLTVLSCEFVAGFSAAGNAEELYDLTASGRRRCESIITRFGGRVANVMGNWVVAYFGHPRANEHDAERAVRAGLATVHELAESGTDHGAPLKARVGIATGMMVVSGTEDDGAEQAAVGEPLLIAAAIRTRAEASVLIDGATRLLVGSLFDYRALDPSPVGGFDAPVPAWRVLRPSWMESRFEALRMSRPGPMIGREEEFELLQRRLAQALEGRGRVVLVSGEPGIGKSRLLAALEDAIRGEPLTRLRYFCSPHHQDTPLYPVIRQLEFAAGFGRDDSPADRLGKLQAKLADTSAEDVAFLAALLQLPMDGLPALNLSPQRRKERTFAVLIRQVERLSRDRPLLMLFEDVHWADASTRDILDDLIHRLAELPVLLVITCRPEFQTPWIGQAGVTLITLSPLDRRDATLLAERSMIKRLLSPALLERIVAHADGVPLFIEELTKAMTESTARTADDASAVSVPATLQGSLLARLDRLPVGKQVAQIGAVIGRDYSHAMISAVAGLSQAVLSEGLDQLVVAGLVFRRGEGPEATYTFKHALVQDAAYDSLMRSRRLALHASIGNALERDAELGATRLALLGHHFAEAGAAEKAVFYFLRAGEHSSGNSAMPEARAHLMRGLAMVAKMADASDRSLRRAELTLALGNVQMATRGYGSSEHGVAFTEAVRLCRLLDPKQEGAVKLLARALCGDFSYALHTGKIAVSRDIANEFLALGRDHADAEIRVMSATLYAINCFILARPREGSQILTAALDDRGFGANPAVVAEFGVDARCLRDAQFSRLLAFQGLPDQARAQIRTSLERARRLGHFPTIAIVLSTLCTTDWILRDQTELETRSSELVRLTSEQGFEFWLARGKGYAGLIAAAKGRLEEGRNLMAEGLAELSRAAILLYVPDAQAMLARVHGLMGQSDIALELLDVALAICASTGEAWIEAELHRQKAELLHTHPLAAEIYYFKAIDTARRHSAKLFELRAAVGLAGLWREHGQRGEAHSLLSPIYASFVEGFDTPDLTDARTLLNELAAAVVP